MRLFATSLRRTTSKPPSQPTGGYVKADSRPSFDALGPTKDPFGEFTEEFFAEGDRGRQLEELRHLARWSRRLLAVTGERGVGKSTLYRALSSGLDPGVKAARINANLTSDTREVLSGIIHGFGMAAPANADPRLLIELISLHVREQIDANRYCLVMIDDAHLLELRALEQLLKLADSGGDDGLRMVFFAEAYFVQSLDKASRRTDQAQNWHEIRLTPFTEEESRRYVAFRLAQAGLNDTPVFSQGQLAVIVGGSSGLPGRIDELASAILSGELKISDERRWLPRLHRALAVLIVIGAGMGWLIFSSHRDRAESPVAGQSAVAVVEAPPSVAAGATQVIALPPAEPAEIPQVQSPAVQEPPVVAAAPIQAPSRLEPEPPAALPRHEATVGPAHPVKALVDTPPQSAKPVVASAPNPVKPDLEQTADAPQAVGKARNSQWLRKQPGKYFTLQLFATNSREKRDRFVAAQADAAQFATFETRRDGVLWYAVVYGSYATRGEATAAAASLTSKLGRSDPWIRTFASIQAILE